MQSPSHQMTNWKSWKSISPRGRKGRGEIISDMGVSKDPARVCIRESLVKTGVWTQLITLSERWEFSCPSFLSCFWTWTCRGSKLQFISYGRRRNLTWGEREAASHLLSSTAAGRSRGRENALTLSLKFWLLHGGRSYKLLNWHCIS